MAGSVNKVILVGNLGKDPEVRRLNSGDQVVSFSVATSETWRDKNSGERKERTEWHNIVIFNEPLGKVAEQYCKKGTKVYLEGQLQTRKWQDQSGADRYTTEVVLQCSAVNCNCSTRAPAPRAARASPTRIAPPQASAAPPQPSAARPSPTAAAEQARSTTTFRFDLPLPARGERVGVRGLAIGLKRSRQVSGRLIPSLSPPERGEGVSRRRPGGDRRRHSVLRGGYRFRLRKSGRLGDEWRSVRNHRAW